MDERDFWYIVAESHELTDKAPLARTVLGEWLVVFRGADGKPAVFRDRCMHRNARLSRGTVCRGQLQCAYHGWTYDSDGQVVAVPAEGDAFKATTRRSALSYSACEVDGYVYVRLSDGEHAAAAPFAMPHHGERGWRTVRLQNLFANTVTNCVENFIDIPHTVFVHPGIFRVSRDQVIDATVERTGGTVHVSYRGETDNLGWFRWFLNPGAHAIEHTDTFVMPNVTTVVYRFGPRRTFIITSQSVPIDEGQTLVYTDLTFDYGLWNAVAAPIVRYQGQAVIDQDLVALADQMTAIEKYGVEFANTAADAIHVFVESIRDALARGEDPRELPDRTVEISFHV